MKRKPLDEDVVAVRCNGCEREVEVEDMDAIRAFLREHGKCARRVTLITESGSEYEIEKVRSQ